MERQMSPGRNYRKKDIFRKITKIVSIFSVMVFVSFSELLVHEVEGNAIDPPTVCNVQDNGIGTVTLPPVECEYKGIDGSMAIIDGLPAGTTIEITSRIFGFICHTQSCGVPGGTLGGETENYDASMELIMTGTSDLAGFNRTVVMPVSTQTHSGPRTPGDPVQIFPRDLFMMAGSLIGDPDFNQLQIIAGTGYGLPSPGSTTITDRGDGTFLVESFFDLTYRIDFVGSPGGVLEGLSGSTLGTERLSIEGNGLIKGGFPWSVFLPSMKNNNNKE